MIAGPSGKRHRRTRRRGFGLVEMAAAGVMVMAAMAVTVHLIGWMAAERLAVARRERAILEASNLLERVAARPWERLTADAVREVALSDATKAALPGAALAIEVADIDAAPAARRITVAITWRDRAGKAEAPARLVGWAYRRGGTR